jgi:hypothetical protein
MTARSLPVALVVVIAAGVFVGSGLAALAQAPSNDPCGDFGALPEGSTSSGSLELWPLGVRCEYYVGSRPARSTFLGPSVAELYAWIVTAALLTSIALLKRNSPLVRGAAAATVLLALSGAGWQFAGINLAFAAAVLFGAPLVFVVDHLLRPPTVRSASASLRVALAIASLLFCAIFAVIFEPRAGIAIGVIAGALASISLARSPRSLTT